MKLNPIRLAMLLGGLPLSSAALSAPLSVTSANQAFSGLVLTPNAQVMQSGDFSYTFAQGVPFRGEIAELDVLKFSLGLFQGLEAHGRIVTKTYNTNLYENPRTGGIRDLSASFKYQIPNFYHHDNLKLAFGMQDWGGAANNFETKYAVADYTFDALPVRASLGYGSSTLNPQVMNGAFGGVEYQPFDFVQLIGEYDSVAYNAMVKVMTPKDFLPYGVKASLGYQLYTSHEKSEQPLWQTQVSVPLAGRFITEPTQVSDRLTLQDKLTVAQQNAQSASLQALKQALLDEGFLNVRLGRHDGQLIVTLENRRYNQNQVDGLGVALGIVSSYYGQSAAAELELTNDKVQVIALTNGIATSKVSTSAQCYRDFLRDNIACSDLAFDTSNPGEVLDAADWQGEQQASGFGRVQLSLAPTLRYGVATEYGVWDYSLALASNVYAPLWKGAALDIRHVTPVANSDDYEEGGYWQNSAFENGVDRVVAHQAFSLPYGFGYQLSLGRIRTDYEGYTHDLAWHSPQGHHSLSYQYSDYEHRDIKGQEKSVSLAGYHYSRPEWDWQLDIVGGEFWNSDKGYEITTNHWFGDFNVFARYLYSQFEGKDKEQFLTLGVAFPIDVWRGMKPGYLQVRGIDQFDFSLQTRIHEKHNYINSGLGGKVNFQHSLERQYHNRSRYGAGYFENQQVRLRNAYLRYLDRD
ncbi:hypothetical protein ATY36_17955 [Vibrio cidicii]|uniref:YjbH domain-containing protein n=1 Tax=Vibrio cidicii TaxID=1763883 RepID=UPI0007800F9B|nr:YjbH domain-containing protein [Vibrio cidicii]KYN80517.1 hypothetical protein ATY36_17955 [Vibrio cidicii]